jgi:hypothetical protein
MRHLVFVGTIVAGLSGGIASGQALGSVRLNRAAIADGKPLAAGLYQIRLTDVEPKPVGQSPNAVRWVEFVKGETVVAREVATVVPLGTYQTTAKEIDTIAKQPPAPADESRVDVREDSNYVHIWINRGGIKYIINMPPAGSQHLPPRPPTGLRFR